MNYQMGDMERKRTRSISERMALGLQTIRCGAADQVDYRESVQNQYNDIDLRSIERQVLFFAEHMKKYWGDIIFH